MQEIRKRNKINEDNVPKKRQHDIKDNIKNIVKGSDQQSSPKNISVRVISRVVVIFSLLIIVYFSSKDDKVKIFARQTDLLAGKGLVLECSSDYLNNIDKYEGCFPKDCKRFVSDKVISTRENEELLTIAKKGLQIHDSSEGMTTLDLDSGALINGDQISNIYKNQDSVFGLNDFNVYRVVKEKIKYAIAHHFEAEPSKIYLTRPSLISGIQQLSSKKHSLNHNEYWHPHVDNVVHESYHYTAFLYLSDYEKDFKGGRLIFIDENVNKTIEPRTGRLSMITSGGENRYFIEKITSGIQYIVTFFFTCDKYYSIADPSANKYVN